MINHNLDKNVMKPKGPIKSLKKIEELEILSMSFFLMNLFVMALFFLYGAFEMGLIMGVIAIFESQAFWYWRRIWRDEYIKNVMFKQAFPNADEVHRRIKIYEG